MLNSIQYLRGIASLFVVLFHMKWMINNIYAQNDLGDLLFIFKRITPEIWSKLELVNCYFI